MSVHFVGMKSTESASPNKKQSAVEGPSPCPGIPAGSWVGRLESEPLLSASGRGILYGPLMNRTHVSMEDLPTCQSAGLICWLREPRNLSLA